MKSTLMDQTPATGLPRSAASVHSASIRSAFTAPNAVAQGTAVPSAVLSAAAEVAVAGARSTDLPGSPPRGAPV